MMDFDKLMKLDDLITEIEINQGRANTMASIIDQDYFELDNDNCKILYFKKAGIEHGILSDYVWKNVELINKARELLNGGTELCKRMILVPLEQYNHMIESYDKAMSKLQEIKEQLKDMKPQDDDVSQELKLYDLMDKNNCDREVAELLLQDEEV